MKPHNLNANMIAELVTKELGRQLNVSFTVTPYFVETRGVIGYRCGPYRSTGSDVFTVYSDLAEKILMDQIIDAHLLGGDPAELVKKYQVLIGDESLASDLLAYGLSEKLKKVHGELLGQTMRVQELTTQLEDALQPKWFETQTSVEVPPRVVDRDGLDLGQIKLTLDHGKLVASYDSEHISVAAMGDHLKDVLKSLGEQIKQAEDNLTGGR